MIAAVTSLYLVIGLLCVVACLVCGVDVREKGLWLLVLLLWPVPMLFGLIDWLIDLFLNGMRLFIWK